MIAMVAEGVYDCRVTRAGGFAMDRIAALLVVALMLTAGVPAVADGIPGAQRPTVSQPRVRPQTVEETIVIEEKQAAPPVVIASPPPPPAPPTTPVDVPVYVWMPGHWTWNAPMRTHVWVPGMYIRPPSPADEHNLALWRLGKWIGIGRGD
jgi:hypothetical protein